MCSFMSLLFNIKFLIRYICTNNVLVVQKIFLSINIFKLQMEAFTSTLSLLTHGLTLSFVRIMLLCPIRSLPRVPGLFLYNVHLIITKMKHVSEEKLLYLKVILFQVAPEGSWSCSICVDTFHRK